MKKVTTTELEVIPFITPNFILVGENKEPMSIAEFTDEELKELCLEFTESLIKKARSRRTNPTKS